MKFWGVIPFLCFSFVVRPTGATLSKVLPMIWSDTKTTLKSGESRLILAVKFQTPCEAFYDENIVPDTKEFFTEWCNKEIIDSVIRPLELMCRPPSLGQRRKKRIVGLITGIATAITGLSTIFGIGSNSKPPDDPRVDQLMSKVSEINQDVQNLKNHVAQNQAEIDILKMKADKTAADIQHLQERTSILEAQQKEMDLKIRLLAEAIDELDERLRVVEIDVDQIKKWKAELTSSLGPTMTLVSKLSAYFEVSKTNLNQVNREWRVKKLDFKLFDVFMLGRNASLVDLYRGATPVECHVDARGGVAYFTFTKDNTDFGVHVLRANPFTLYEMKNGSQLGFKLEYVGPKQVAYDGVSDCIVPYADGPADVLLFPKDKDCIIMNDLSVYKYWRKSCELMYYLDDSVIQVKALEEQYYIYCYGFQVSIYKATHECPNYVFSVSNKERIEILNGKNVAKILRPSTFETTQDFHSTKAVYHLMPKILELNFDSFPLSSSCPLITGKPGDLSGAVRDREPVHEGGVTNSALLAGLIVLGIAIVIIGGVLFWYVRKRTAAQAQPERGRRDNFDNALENQYEELNQIPDK